MLKLRRERIGCAIVATWAPPPLDGPQLSTTLFGVDHEHSHSRVSRHHWRRRGVLDPALFRLQANRRLPCRSQCRSQGVPGRGRCRPQGIRCPHGGVSTRNPAPLRSPNPPGRHVGSAGLRHLHGLLTWRSRPKPTSSTRSSTFPIARTLLTTLTWWASAPRPSARRASLPRTSPPHGSSSAARKSASWAPRSSARTVTWCILRDSSCQPPLDLYLRDGFSAYDIEHDDECELELLIDLRDCVAPAIRRAPRQIDTAHRQSIEAEFQWTSLDSGSA